MKPQYFFARDIFFGVWHFWTLTYFAAFSLYFHTSGHTILYKFLLAFFYSLGFVSFSWEFHLFFCAPNCSSSGMCRGPVLRLHSRPPHHWKKITFQNSCAEHVSYFFPSDLAFFFWVLFRSLGLYMKIALHRELRASFRPTNKKIFQIFSLFL